MSVIQRQVWIDWAKAIGILLVVMGHSHYSWEGIHPMIFMIHMPLFFWVSGYLYNVNKSFKQIIMNNVQKLLVPYCLFNLIFLIYWILLGSIKMCIGQSYDWTVCVIAPLLHTLGGVALGIFNGPTWFLLALFWCKIFCYGIHQGSHFWKLFCICIWCVLLSVRSFYELKYPFALDCACAGMIWFEVGHKMRQLTGKIHFTMPIILVCISLGILICLYILNYQGHCNYILAKTGGILGIIGSGAGLMAYICICKFLDKFDIPIIILVSKASILIMCLHMFFSTFLEQVLHYNHHTFFTFAIDVLLTLSITALYPVVQKFMPTLIGGGK